MQDLEKLKKIASSWAIFENGDYLPAQKEWVFYGGSFGPWHAGHSMCLKLFHQLKQDWPFILPDRNPHKESKEIKNLWDYYQSLAPEIKEREKYIYPGFILTTQPNPTITWIEKIAKKFPDRSLGLLIGFDSFLNLPKWLRYQELLSSLHHLYVVSRQEEDQFNKTDFEASLKKINPTLSIHYLGHHPYEHLSSTKLRA